MSLSSLQADDCSGTQSMENWLNAGGDWTEHHGMIDAPTASPPLFYNATQASTTMGMKVGDSIFELSLQKGAAPLTTYPFLKLDTQELCKENPDAVLVRTGSSSMVDSSCNDDEINSTGLSVAVPSVLNRTLSLDDANFSVEADSPRGPLSPAALQLGKSPRAAGVKRQFDDLQTPPAVPYAPFAAMTSSPAFLPATPNVAPAPAPGLIFPAPLTLPNVPTLEEIAQSRPKRRNVRISKDPQSVAARHRRERISDRVRVLQHFVPGGTKMDTASMLDEAIQYVKFLQHQLQTLERLGSAYDARFMTPGGSMLMPHVGSNGVRLFDLNCAVNQSYPSGAMMHGASVASQPQPTWPASPFCNQSFPDSAQEQFCH